MDHSASGISVPRFQPTLLIVALLGIAHAAAAQTTPAAPTHDLTALAKETQNPAGSLTSVPFQINFNTGGELEERSSLTVNFQPVVPFNLTEEWSVIARTIVPLQSLPGADGQRFSGVGDIQQEIFIKPRFITSMTIAAGPYLSYPTATTAAAETGTWAAGIAAVVSKHTGPWVLGGLVSQAWPMSDEGGDPEVDLFSFQPFINLNFGKGWALGFSPTITANWNAAPGDQWTVPLGLGLTKTTLFDRRPMNIGIAYYHHVERPKGSASSLLRFTITLLYPQG